MTCPCGGTPIYELMRTVRWRIRCPGCGVATRNHLLRSDALRAWASRSRKYAAGRRA